MLYSDLGPFVLSFNGFAASILARFTTVGTELTTILNALFLIACSHDGAATNRI